MTGPSPSRNPGAARWLRHFARDIRAATAVEYGLILAVVVLVMVVALIGLADVTVGMWTDVSTKVQTAH